MGPKRPSGESRANGFTSPALSLGEACAESGASQKLEEDRASFARVGTDPTFEAGDDSSCHENWPAAFAVAYSSSVNHFSTTSSIMATLS